MKRFNSVLAVRGVPREPSMGLRSSSHCHFLHIGAASPEATCGAWGTRLRLYSSAQDVEIIVHGDTMAILRYQ